MAWLDISSEEARELVEWGETERFRVVRDSLTFHSRWSVGHFVVIEDKVTGRLYADNYSVGATENQDELPWDYTPPRFREVVPVEVTTIEYQYLETLADSGDEVVEGT